MTASGTDLIDAFSRVDALEAAGLAGLGAVASIIFSVVSTWAGDNGTASLVPDIVDADDHTKPPPHPEV